jgi:hypothetical protein
MLGLPLFAPAAISPRRRETDGSGRGIRRPNADRSNRYLSSAADRGLKGIASTGTLGHKARMLVIDDLSVRVAGALLIDQASARIPAGAQVGR